MRAAQLTAPRQWELIETDKPEPVDGQILVRMERVAVCGSDQPPYCGVHEGYPQPIGMTGHEGLGIVEACPSGRYQEGERVLLWGFDRGLFQEYVLADDKGGCIRLPTDLPEEKVLMSQLLGTVIHSFYKLGNIIDQDVLVIGQGPVGLLFNAVLRNLGARRIIALDKLDYRLEVGRRMGAPRRLDELGQDVDAGVLHREAQSFEVGEQVAEAAAHVEHAAFEGGGDLREDAKRDILLCVLRDVERARVDAVLVELVAVAHRHRGSLLRSPHRSRPPRCR